MANNTELAPYPAAVGSNVKTEQYVFDQNDYESYVPLDKQIEVLASLGIERPTEEQIQDYREMVKENSYARVYLEGFPYQMILSNLGFGEYDGETYEQILKSPTVYSFDFEGWDISQDYIDVLNGIQFIANEEFQLQDIREDCSQVNWEEGTGSVVVSFFYNQTRYQFKAEMDNDWIDPRIIPFFNSVLEQEGNRKRIYTTSDGGQGAILFYNDESWAKEFEEKTGLELETGWEVGKGEMSI